MMSLTIQGGQPLIKPLHKEFKQREDPICLLSSLLALKSLFYSKPHYYRTIRDWLYVSEKEIDGELLPFIPELIQIYNFIVK